MSDVKVSVDGVEWTLSAPKSLTIRWEIAALSGKSPIRAAGAALGACHRRPLSARPKASLAGCGHDVAAYGQAVADELLGRGVDIGDLMQAGNVALEVLSADLISADEVEAISDFSEAPEGSTS